MTKKTAKKKLAKKKVAKKAASRKTQARKSTATQAQDYAHEIWLAGLGAFSLAQQEGSKLFEKGRKSIESTSSQVVGESSKLFERLVKEGSKLETRGRKVATDSVSGVRGDVESRVGKVRETAQSNWDKLEKVFEQRVARALAGLGVPSSDEIKELNSRVAELNKRVREFSEQQKKAAPKGKSDSAAS